MLNLIFSSCFQGMVEGLEEEIRSFFVRNPSEKSYVLKGLSSYERLLAHAASAYNYLKSRSTIKQTLNRLHRADQMCVSISRFRQLVRREGVEDR